MMDIRLYYEKAGDGEPLILLHGNGEDGTYFKHQMEYFSKDYRVIAIDTRGHGKSPRGEKPFTIRQFAEDLNGFMEEQGMEKAHLLGFSDGGNIALAFALRYPGKVESLILNGANLCPAGVKPCRFRSSWGIRSHPFLAGFIIDPGRRPRCWGL